MGAPHAAFAFAVPAMWSMCACVSRMSVTRSCRRVDDVEQLIDLVARVDDDRVPGLLAREHEAVLVERRRVPGLEEHGGMIPSNDREARHRRHPARPAADRLAGPPHPADSFRLAERTRRRSGPSQARNAAGHQLVQGARRAQRGAGAARALPRRRPPATRHRLGWQPRARAGVGGGEVRLPDGGLHPEGRAGDQARRDSEARRRTARRGRDLRGLGADGEGVRRRDGAPVHLGVQPPGPARRPSARSRSRCWRTIRPSTRSSCRSAVAGCWPGLRPRFTRRARTWRSWASKPRPATRSPRRSPPGASSRWRSGRRSRTDWRATWTPTTSRFRSSRRSFAG